MIIAQYFVEFIFYSFLGWVWESIYCTINEKKWADRGFLFGPVCPIYGSCVVAVSILFSLIPALSDPSFPIWAIFIICMIGSAVAEFGTSWVLEKRFHARWWDYSKLPLNIQGRICLPVSVCFGIAGVLIVKYLMPFVSGLHALIHPSVYEVFAIILAAVFGADFALTEASLSALLKDVEMMHQEFVEKAQANYERVEERVKEAKERKLAMEEKVREARENLPRLHAGGLSLNQKRILVSIEKFMPDKNKTLDQNEDRNLLISELKHHVIKLRSKVKKS
ncbi:putative ABC transporter permease [Butyrivibrio sp. FCS014]|uniref:putative ABC transporter permease n=1 Tax=Butyrivibrio sp. FCS014 TaxID=1408304 RepID=UPI000466D313|nr:putative ABC transporter permease [Butyrivibrio sp. FCS014]